MPHRTGSPGTRDYHIDVVDLFPAGSRRLLSGVPSFSAIKKLVSFVLIREKIRAAHLTLVFVTDPYIKRLNQKYLTKDKETDVLAFDLALGCAEPSSLVGDIVVSLDAAQRASFRLKEPLRREVLRYCVHGILHLCGYDDLSAPLRKKMWARQEKILSDFEK